MSFKRIKQGGIPTFIFVSVFFQLALTIVYKEGGGMQIHLSHALPLLVG